MTRSKQSPIAGAMELAAQLSWPAGLGIVVLVYLALRFYADPAELATNPAGLPATLGDFLFGLPLLFWVLGAAVFCLRRRKSPGEVALGPGGETLTGVEGQEFAGLVAEAFQHVGYLVVDRSGDASGSVDLELFLGGERYLVHCRQWQASRVDAALLRTLYAAMRSEQAVGCFIVTSGKYTDEARAFAVGRAIRLVPATALRAMLAQESRA